MGLWTYQVKYLNMCIADTIGIANQSDGKSVLIYNSTDGKGTHLKTGKEPR
jgi:hypothetical protein